MHWEQWTERSYSARTVLKGINVSDGSKVLCEIHGQVALLSLNKPELRNAICTQLLAELRQHFQQLEKWSDRIINDGPTAIEALIEKYPQADRQQLRNLQRQASRELAEKKAPTAARKIFAYLRELSE